MNIIIPKVLTKFELFQRMKATGRRRGQTLGTYMDNMVQLRRTVLLCATCRPHFDATRLRYYSVGRYEQQPFQGQCYACRYDMRGQDFGYLFIPEETRHRVWRSPPSTIERTVTP